MTTKKAAASAHKGRAKAANGQNTEKSTAPRRNTSNLRPPWPKGVSGNPGGRPKRTLSDALRSQLGELHPKKGRSIVELIAAALLKKALRGDVKAVSLIGDRTEGKPHQQIDVTGQMNVSVVIDL